MIPVFRGLKRYLSQKWEVLSIDSRLWILDRVESIINYSYRSLFFSVPLCIVLLMLTSIGIRDLFLLILSVALILPFFEHYYVWLREEWKDELTRKK